MEPPADPLPDDLDATGRPPDRRRRTTASGGVAAAFALGLRQVFDPQPVDTVGIELEAPTRPVDPDEVELRFDPMSSSNTVVVVRHPDAN